MSNLRLFFFCQLGVKRNAKKEKKKDFPQVVTSFLCSCLPTQKETCMGSRRKFISFRFQQSAFM